MSKPEVLPSGTARVRMGCGYIYVTIADDASSPQWIFTVVGKAGICQDVLLKSLSKVVAVALQEGVPPARIIKTLRGTVCPEAQPGDAKTRYTSCVDVLAREIERRLKDGKVE